MIKCKLCGCEYNALGIHLRRTHKISVDDYLSQFPGSPTMTEETREAHSKANQRRFELGNGTENFFKGHQEYVNSDAHKKRMIAHNKNPKFIDSQRERLSKLATDTNRRMWQEDYETCRGRAAKNALWAARTSCITGIQVIVADYLKEKCINYTLEKYFTFSNRRVRVDIYLDNLDLVIEVNGLYWHGKPDTPLEEMSEYQKEGYERDRFKESVFGDKLLFLWEDEILSGEFKNKLDEFIAIGHVKLGELLET